MQEESAEIREPVGWDASQSPATPPAPTLELPRPRKPRIWTVAAVFVLTFAAVIGVQVVLAIGLLIWLVQQGLGLQQAAARIAELVVTPEFFIGFGIPTQLTMLLMALAAAWFSHEPLSQRLGLGWPRAKSWQIGVWLVGALVPFLLGLGAAQLLAEVIPPDPTAGKLYENMHWAIAAPFILFIAIVPGITEEVLFRGYIQRRLTRRWSVWVGILVTSLLFGVMHIMPHTVVFAFILGIWLGLMAWRTDSIWPGAVCHALVNGLWNILNIGIVLNVFPAEFPLPLLIAIVAVGVVAFAVACWDLFTYRRDETTLQ